MSKKARKQFINEELERIYKKVSIKIDKIVDDYLRFLDCNTEKLTEILGDIKFFSGKSHYKKIYELYQKIYDLRIKIQNSARHFNYYKNGSGSKAIVLSEILELQKSIFRVEEKQNCILIYNSFVDEMNKKLEKIRAKLIYNIEEEEYKENPVLEIIKK